MIAFVVDFLLFLFIYRVVKGLKLGSKSCAEVGALIRALFLAIQYLLNLYFDHVYKVPAIFGSLAIGIIRMLWMQLTGLLTFYGAELIYVLENGAAVDSLQGSPAGTLHPAELPDKAER